MDEDNKLSPFWLKILSPLAGFTKNKSERLADVLRNSIKTGEIADKQKLPTQKQIIILLGWSKKTVEVAYRDLKNGGHIVTDGTVGTRACSVGNDADMIGNPESHARLYRLDIENLSPSLAIMNYFNKNVRKARNKSPQLGPEQKKYLLNSKFVSQFTTLVNLSLPATYRVDQTCFCYTRAKAIDSICRITLTAGKSVVMFDAAEVLIKNAFLANTSLVHIIQSDSSINLLAQLEQTCIDNQVGIVYFSSRVLLSLRIIFKRSVIEKIFELRRKYGFTIIEDDPYAAFYKKMPNILMDVAQEMNEELFYMRKLTMCLPNFTDVIIICSKTHNISALSKLIRDTGETIKDQKLAILFYVVMNNALPNTERKVYDETIKLNRIARKLLTEANLWKTDGIENEEGWFFTLKLLKGIFPENIYQLLAAFNVYIVDPEKYKTIQKGVTEIQISVVNYMQDYERFEKDLNLFHEKIREIQHKKN